MESSKLPWRRRTQGQSQTWVTRASLAGRLSKQSLSWCEFRGTGRPSFSKKKKKKKDKSKKTQSLSGPDTWPQGLPLGRTRTDDKAHLGPRATVSSKEQLPSFLTSPQSQRWMEHLPSSSLTCEFTQESTGAAGSTGQEKPGHLLQPRLQRALRTLPIHQTSAVGSPTVPLFPSPGIVCGP